MYVGGYIVYSVPKKNSCNVCKEFFILTKTDSTVIPKADNYCFNVINRGSLKYPSHYVMYIILTVAFKVFKIILSERYESEILPRKKNKLVLRSTILEFVDL